MMIAAAISLLLATALQAEAAPQPEIIGYQYTCSATVPTGATTLQGALVLDEEGKAQSFSAQYYGEPDAIDTLFFEENWDELERRHIPHHLRLRLIWNVQDLAARPAGSLPTFEDGDLRLNISTRRRLPEQVFLLLSRKEHGSSGLIVNAYRWQGRQTSAEFSVPLAEVFGFKGDAPRLKWRLVEPPLPVEWSYSAQRRRAEGWVEPDAVRTVEPAFARLAEQLQTKRGAYRQSCERVPVYYDPLSDI